MSSSLMNKTVNGILWVALERISIQLLQISINILLARILLPQDYGVIGILAVFLAVADILVDCGFGNSLIQNKNRTSIDYSTAFFFNAIVGIILYFCLYLSADFISDFYDLPILENIITIYSLNIIISSLKVVQTAKLTIELRFKIQTIIALLSQVTAAIVALILAYKDFGVWALVYYNLIGNLISMTLLWVFAKWVPSWVFSFVSFKKMFNFGYKILFAAIINTIYSHIHSIVIGKKYSIEDVGFYNRGNQFPVLLSSTLLGIFMKVCYPVLSELQDDTQKLTEAYKRFLVLPMFILVPALVLLAILAKPIVLVLLGDKWLPCVPFLIIMCFGAMFDPLTYVNLNLLYVKGRTDLVLKLEIIKKTIAFSIIFISMYWGIYWLCIGQSLYCLIAYLINCHYTNRYIMLTFMNQVKLLLPIFVKSFIVGIFALFISYCLSDGLLKILIVSVGYCICYLIVCHITHDKCLKEYISIMKDRFYKK